MQVFISWHGGASKAMAEVLRTWLPSVIQQVQPFLSSEDIHKGDVWFGEVSAKLDSSSVGILRVAEGQTPILREECSSPRLINRKSSLTPRTGL